MTLRHRGAGLALGVALDQLLADPQRHHPVAWFGSWATRAEKVVYADSRAAGALFTAAAIAPALAGGIVVEKAASRRGWLQVAATAAATWAALGVRRLANEGGIMADRLDSGDLEAAREQLPNLCGRDPRTLDEEGLGRATVESMAENTNDAGVCTLLWGAVAGCPGSWPTVRSTPSTPWSATATNATGGLARLPPSRTMPPPGCRPGSPVP